MMPERSQARANPARGIALISTAVVLGLALLRQWPDSGSASAGISTVADPAEQATEGGDGTEDTTATTAAARPPAEVTVRVLNATDIGGAAGKLTDLIKEHGHPTDLADDAPDSADPATTTVLYLPGYEAEASALALAIGAPNNAIAALDPATVDPLTAQLVVLLGTDVAEKVVGGN